MEHKKTERAFLRRCSLPFDFWSIVAQDSMQKMVFGGVHSGKLHFIDWSGELVFIWNVCELHWLGERATVSKIRHTHTQKIEKQSPKSELDWNSFELILRHVHMKWAWKWPPEGRNGAAEKCNENQKITSHKMLRHHENEYPKPASIYSIVRIVSQLPVEFFFSCFFFIHLDSILSLATQLFLHSFIRNSIAHSKRPAKLCTNVGRVCENCGENTLSSRYRSVEQMPRNYLFCNS